MADCVVVFVTCPPGPSAGRLATLLVRERLAACVNIVPRIRSVYRWKRKVERAAEVLLVMKTTAKRFPALRRAVCAAHPYDVPEVIAMPIRAGHAPYLKWVKDSVA
jgi:periplasmic divalent cation tolerance protein